MYVLLVCSIVYSIMGRYFVQHAFLLSEICTVTQVPNFFHASSKGGRPMETCQPLITYTSRQQLPYQQQYYACYPPILIHTHSHTHTHTHTRAIYTVVFLNPDNVCYPSCTEKCTPTLHSYSLHGNLREWQPTCTQYSRMYYV